MQHVLFPPCVFYGFNILSYTYILDLDFLDHEEIVLILIKNKWSLENPATLTMCLWKYTEWGLPD